MTTPSSLLVLIPAYNEAARVAATVRAARALSGAPRVVVIDDGSTDDTAAQARAAGAKVHRMPANGGKGAALRAGLAQYPGAPEQIVLLLDADVGASAAEAEKLLAPVRAEEADLAIARFPATGVKAGFGLAKGLGALGTRLIGGVRLQAPLSGQRAVRRWALDAAPIADGYGAEVAMNSAAAEAGARIVEVETTMTHAATGRTLAGFRHRGRQFLHIAGALLAALFGRTGERLIGRLDVVRVAAWTAALLWLHLLFTRRIAVWRAAPDVPAACWLPLAALLGPPLAAVASALLRVRRPNYRGRRLPALGGITLLPLLLGFALFDPGHFRRQWPVFFPAAPSMAHWLPLLLPAALFGWLLLGLVDDLYGSAERKGLRGHLRALAGGRLTTGGVKLLGGGVLALGMAWVLAAARGDQFWVRMLLGAPLIALAANAINLLDLRPGRALKVVWAVAVPLLLALTALLHDPLTAAQFLDRYLAQLLAFVLLATLLYAPFDFAGMMMLGDTGANPLGACLGAVLAAVLPPWALGVVVALLVLFHIYTERVSLTRVIERVPVLRWLDALGRSA